MVKLWQATTRWRHSALWWGALALLAATLFLNYRPRAPHVFSTRYGNPYTTGQMVDAICALRGQGVRGQLRAHGWTGSFPCARRAFAVPGTGEEFEVSEVTGQVVIWRLGRHKPLPGAPAARTEAYHRAFLQRYCPALPPPRLQMPRRHPPACLSFRYVPTAPDGTRLDGGYVLFTWNKGGSGLQQVRFGREALGHPHHAHLRRVEAEQKALDRAYGTRGLRSVAIDRGNDDPDLVALTDQLGVQRCIYPVWLGQMKWAPEAHPLTGCLCDAPPDGNVLFVDAGSGATVPVAEGPLWEAGLARRRLCLWVADESVDYVLYPPLRLGVHAYLCGKYLQSYLWGGRYTPDAGSGRFRVEDRGVVWTGRRGSRFLHGPEGLSMCWAAPRTIDGELYLPLQMVARITGWRLRLTLDFLRAVPPGGGN